MSILNEPVTHGPKATARSVVPGQRSYTVVGGMVQRLPLNLRFRANANYYSSIVTQQNYQQDIYRCDATARAASTPT